MEIYNYKLPGTTFRRITRKNITDVKRAINNYCNNPIKGRREFNSVVIDFIFITLGFKNINNSIDIKKFKRDTPQSDKKKALGRIIELINIIINMISENEDKIQIEKDNGNFIDYLVDKLDECEAELEGKPKQVKNGTIKLIPNPVEVARNIMKRKIKPQKKLEQLRGILKKLDESYRFFLNDGRKEDCKKIDSQREEIKKIIENAERGI